MGSDKSHLDESQIHEINKNSQIQINKKYNARRIIFEAKIKIQATKK